MSRASTKHASGAEQKCTTREVIGQCKCPRQLFGRSVTGAGWQMAGRAIHIPPPPPWGRGLSAIETIGIVSCNETLPRCFPALLFQWGHRLSAMETFGEHSG